MNLLNLIPGLKLKSVSTLDDMYVDEEGKHIIFRQIGGQTVPIRSDSEGYASWLENQGIDIDPADQKTLRELDKQMDIFDRAREAGGPELQQEYQKAFEKQLKEREKLVKQYYQQALQKQAQKQETTPEKLQEQKKQTFEQHKDKLVSRHELPDRGWGSYIRGFTDKIIKNAGVDHTSKLYHALRAYDLILMKAQELAKKGVEPSKINMHQLIKSEIEQSNTFSELYKSRYSEIAEQEGFSPSLFLGQMHFALETLDDNFEQGTPGAKELQDSFDAIYRKMHDDFNPEKEEELNLGAGLTVGAGVEKIPETLPEQFTSTEASAVKNLFETSKGQPVGAAHKATLHTLSRLFDSIPEHERVKAAIEISNERSGVHAVHKDAYKKAWGMYKGYGMDISIEDTIDNIVREAMRAQDGTTTDKINAMKRIAHHMGTMDGLFLAKKDDKGYQSHAARWVHAAMNAGRARGEGPDLINQILDDSNRKANTYSNKILKIPSSGDPRPTSRPEMSEVPQKEEAPRKLQKGEVHPGFFHRDGKIYSEEGYSIDIEGTNWNVHSPDGKKVGMVPIERAKNKDGAERVKNAAFSQVRDIINSHTKSEQDVKKDQTKEVSSRFAAFDFKSELTDDEKEFISSIDPSEYDVSTVSPGVAYRVKKGDNFVDVIHSKGKLLLGFKNEEGSLQVENATVDAFNTHFSRETKKSVRNIVHNFN